MVDVHTPLFTYPETQIALSSTLSLSIGESLLKITDSRLSKKRSRTSCGSALCGKALPSILEIPLYNVLWAELGDSKLTIDYARQVSKSVVKPAKVEYTTEGIADKQALQRWTQQLIERAYEEAIPAQRIKVLVNPHGGRGFAERVWKSECEPIFTAARCKFDVELTTYYKHAIEIARDLDISCYDTVICVSGDGLPHEVFNGFAKRKDAGIALRKIAVCQLPGGSGNGMCWSLTGTDSGSLASLVYVKGKKTPLDLASITQGEERILSVLSQSYGIVAESDLGTEHLRWMGGQRFNYGLLTRIWNKTSYPCDIAVKTVMEDKAAVRDYYRRGGNPVEEGEEQEEEGLPPLKFGTVNDDIPEGWELKHHPLVANFYTGNMSRVSADANFFPASLPNEGMLDLVCVDSTISRGSALQMMLDANSGKHFNQDCVSYKKVEAYRLIPKPRKRDAIGYISIDGEKIAFAPFQAESHRGLGRTLTKDGRFTGAGV